MTAKRAAAAIENAPATSGAEKRGPKEDRVRSRFTFVFNRMEDLPSMMAFTKMIQTPMQYLSSTDLNEKSTEDKVATSSPVSIDALRLLELSERMSAAMKASDLETTARHDALSNIYGTFAGLNGFKVAPQMAIVQAEDFPLSVTNFARDKYSDMIVVPWAAGTSTTAADEGPAVNPFENLFRNNTSSAAERSPQYAAFVRATFLKANCDVGLFLDRGAFGEASAIPGGRQHIYLPFFGGADDRMALELVMQLARHPGVTAAVVRLVRAATPTEEDQSSLASKSNSGNSLAAEEPSAPMHFTVHAGGAGADTVYGANNTQHQLQSETADNLALAHFFPAEFGAREAPTHSAAVTSALTRAKFTTVNSVSPLKASLAHANQQAESSSSPLLVVTGRSRRGGVSHREELEQFLKEHVTKSTNGVASLGLAASSEVRKTLGDCASALVVANIAGSILVVQSGSKAAQSV